MTTDHNGECLCEDCGDEPKPGDVEWAMKQQASFEYDNDLPLYDAWATLKQEVERLRAANAELETENTALQRDAQDAQADRVELERLRAEVDWFRRREADVQECMRADNPPDAETACLGLQEWVRDNPKPGAGE